MLLAGRRAGRPLGLRLRGARAGPSGRAARVGARVPHPGRARPGAPPGCHRRAGRDSSQSIPLREGFHAQRILALYRSGRQSDASRPTASSRGAGRRSSASSPAPAAGAPQPGAQAGPGAGLAAAPGAPEPTHAGLTAETHHRAQVPSPVASSEAGDGLGRRRRLGALAAVAGGGCCSRRRRDDPRRGTRRLPRRLCWPTRSASSTRRERSWPRSRSAPNPIAVASSRGAIWVVNAGDDTVSRVDLVDARGSAG